MERLEYNPLFESLAKTANKYGKINEQEAQGSSEYKIKSAKEYALRILQMVYDEYLYFLNSVPNEDLRKKYKSDIVNFMDAESKKTDVNLDLLTKALITKWQTFNNSDEVKNIVASSENMRKAYANIEEGISKLSELGREYVTKYGNEMKDPSVTSSIKEFMTNALTNLQKA